MKIHDMMQDHGRVFLKSEWGQIGDEWPCVSFTKKTVGDRLRAEFRPGRDILIYVGTTNAEFTEEPDHRGRLISAVVIQPNQVLETRRIIPPESWQKSTTKWGRDRWPHAMAVIRAANVVGPPYPHAHDVVPKAYRSFAESANRGSFVEAFDEERAMAMAIDVEEITLSLSEDVRRYLQMIEATAPQIDKAINQEVTRMAELIQNRATAGGQSATRLNPLRFTPNLSDLISILTHKWVKQKGTCRLCGGQLTRISHATNGLRKG
jgi:hypothetical protein